jgi:hypothetical protein
MGRKNRWTNGRSDPKLNDLKLILCQKIEAAILHDRRTDEAAAIWLGTSRAVISKIRRQRLDELSLNQLFFFLARLRPHFQILISSNRWD